MYATAFQTNQKNTSNFEADFILDVCHQSQVSLFHLPHMQNTYSGLHSFILC